MNVYRETKCRKNEVLMTIVNPSIMKYDVILIFTVGVSVFGELQTNTFRVDTLKEQHLYIQKQRVVYELAAFCSCVAI